MKKISLILLIFLFCLCSCVYQAENYPQKNLNEIWICEEPYAEFGWTEKENQVGKIIYKKKEYKVEYYTTYGALMIVYTDDIVQFDNNLDEYDPYELFRGRVNYEKDCFTLTVEEDKQNIFGGEKPVMKFVKHNKEKYFNGKNIEVKNVEHRNK